ncbi:MAG: hypothetical protein K2X27_14810 [Candidatus Obscuribacterales bacterium]|nr:hypothetical protein [Candidatus Obscuribacterales bacterium]
MINYFFRKKTEDALRRQSVSQRAYSADSCKRTVALFPDSNNRSLDLKDTVALRFHHLLVSLEGAERTGCLKITSNHARSRSAMLLFRGRVVGCVYGRKSMRGQYLHEDAHQCALADLAAPGNILDAYELPEELVLAASSLFYGETMDISMGQSVENIFDTAVNSLKRSGLPGCVVVNTMNEQTICIVYIAKGRVVGLFSAFDGWTHGSPDSVKQFLKSGECKVHASILTVADPRTLGFSLSGLGDKTDSSFDATPYQDFSPSAVVMTPSREAVARAVRQHRQAGQMQSSARNRSHARV